MIIDPGEANNVPKVAEVSAHDAKDSNLLDDTRSLYAPPPPYASDLQRLRNNGSTSSHPPSSAVFHPSQPSSSSSTGSTRLPPPRQATAQRGPTQTGSPDQYRNPASVVLRNDIHSPPPSWSRAPPNIREGYTPFEPIFLIARGRFLDKGFPPVPPPAPFGSHPFANHDICQQDWIQFLEDIRLSSKLTPGQKNMAEGLPLISMVPVVSTLVAHAIKSQMKRKKEEPASLIVDAWNHHFFNPRKVEVILMRGPVRISGTKNYPIPNLHVPETVNFSMANVPGLEWNPASPASTYSSHRASPSPEASTSRQNLPDQLLPPESHSQRARKLSKQPSRTNLDRSPPCATLTKTPSHHTVNSTSGSAYSATGTLTKSRQTHGNSAAAERDKTYRLFIVATNR